MAARPSLQKKLDRVRKPRVQIKYEVAKGDAMEMRELPFVMGVLGDFSGKPEQPLAALKDREFKEIDRDNFNKVLASFTPRLAYRVADKLSGEKDSQLNVELKFRSLDDFSPENVVRQIEPLRKMLDQRDKLKNLLNRMDGNDKLEELLLDILQNTQSREALTRELGLEESAPQS
jgi:type VI secretion system protein ImpB